MMSMTSLERDICDYKIRSHYNCSSEQCFLKLGRWELEASLGGIHRVDGKMRMLNLSFPVTAYMLTQWENAFEPTWYLKDLASLEF